MSGITQASGFPLATASGDQVFALLHMISDEKLFRARLVQLQTAEENAHKILTAAADAQAEATKLQKQQDKARVELERDRADFNAAKTLNEQQSAQIGQAQLARERDTNDKLQELNDSRASFETYKKRSLEDIDNRKVAIDKRERAVYAREQAIVSLEAKVHAKWTLIQQISAAGE
jgi:predicted  nucleic acid-binding Zn-ribbon protein